eukprot:1032740-Rhodomonas_salina.1
MLASASALPSVFIKVLSAEEAQIRPGVLTPSTLVAAHRVSLAALPSRRSAGPAQHRHDAGWLQGLGFEVSGGSGQGGAPAMEKPTEGWWSTTSGKGT